MVLPDFIRPVHEILAGLALLIFVWRGLRMWRNQPVRKIVWRRVIPDSIDTLLLLSGITMLVMLGWNPLDHAWLLAKLMAVLGYITLGFIALHSGHSRPTQRFSFVAALIIFGYVVALAHTKAIFL